MIIHLISLKKIHGEIKMMRRYCALSFLLASALTFCDAITPQKIIDTHLGSGSSAIAAHYYGVDFVGCETDVDYFKAAKDRIERETRQINLFEVA